jgi:tRNA pseudouridine55 synthase
LDGILLLSKPPVWTSHDLVDAVRRKVGQKAVGHAGTLDPMATGLMILLLGAATKRSAAFSGLDKGYRGSIRLGVETDSWDLDGKIVSEKEVPAFAESDVRAALASLTGDVLQRPPAFSALKRGGKRSYELARRGQAVEMEPRPVSVPRFELQAFDTPEIYFDLDCSKGTYVRSLAHAVGGTLGCGAALSSLVRTRIGEFRLEQALTHEDFEKTANEDLRRLLR